MALKYGLKGSQDQSVAEGNASPSAMIRRHDHLRQLFHAVNSVQQSSSCAGISLSLGLALHERPLGARKVFFKCVILEGLFHV